MVIFQSARLALPGKFTVLGSLVNQEGDDEAVLSNHSYQQGFHNGCIIGVHFDRLRGMLSYRRDNVFLGKIKFVQCETN